MRGALRLVFCGTPAFAVPTLRALLDAGHDIAMVLTQPDRPAGRRLDLHAPPVKQFALEHGLEVWQPERIKNNDALRTRLQALHPDAIPVVAYGRIIPEWMLTLPRFGNINLHASLLPKYRGAAPIQWAVAMGEQETGVVTMQLNAGLDTGDLLLEERVPIAADTMAAELFSSLAELGAPLMVKTLAGLEAGSIVPKPQDHAAATLAPILTREDGRIRPAELTAQQMMDRWRGFYPWPGAWAEFRGKRVLVHAMRMGPPMPDLDPGELRLIRESLVLGTADGRSLEWVELQTEGKSRLSGDLWARAHQLRAGERLG